MLEFDLHDIRDALPQELDLFDIEDSLLLLDSCSSKFCGSSHTELITLSIEERSSLFRSFECSHTVLITFFIDEFRSSSNSSRNAAFG